MGALRDMRRAPERSFKPVFHMSLLHRHWLSLARAWPGPGPVREVRFLRAAGKPIEAAILNRLGHVRTGDARHAGDIGNGAGDFQDTVIAAG